MRRLAPGPALAFALLALVPAPEAAPPAFKVVVASTNPVAALDRGDLAKMFLKNVTRWKDGKEIVPVDQLGRSEVRTEFTKDVLEKAGMSRISAVESDWQQQIYSGRGVPPPGEGRRRRGGGVRGCEPREHRLRQRDRRHDWRQGRRSPVGAGGMDMRSRQTLTLVAGLVAALAAVGAPAQDLPGNLQIHGFASQGYLKSSANDYIAVKTSEGSFAMTEAALNVTAQPLEGLRIGVQLYGRDLGAAGNNKVAVDWAMGDYRWKNWLGFRAGRIKLPLGFYNTLRDVDMARAEVLQPSSLYPISQRDLNAAFDGGSLYGTVSLGGGGSLEYEGFFGTQDLDDIYIVERFIRDGAQASLPGLGAIGIRNPNYTLGRIQADMEHLFGVNLVWKTPVPGLRVGASHEQSKSRFQSETTYFGTLGPAPVSFL